jgi:hypothetical protein
MGIRDRKPAVVITIAAVIANPTFLGPHAHLMVFIVGRYEITAGAADCHDLEADGEDALRQRK